jgi:4-amino-4-deoxy-L-arabinose transferase-like glycosyltransferase
MPLPDARASAAGQPRRSTAGGWIGTTAFLLVLALYGTFLLQRAGRPLETDELKYIALARNLTSDPGSYTLRGTLLLPRLARDVNDVPLFYHPPLVPILLRGWYESALHREGEVVPLESAHSEDVEPGRARQRAYTTERLLGAAAPSYSVVPIAAQLATLAALWFYWGRRRSLAEGLWPIVLLAVSPVAGEFATQVWLDGVLALLMFLTLTAYHRAVERGRWWDFSLAGLALGLALLTKFTAVLLLPLLGLYHLAAVGWDRAAAWKRAAAALLPALALAAPWFVLFFSTYGELLPSWIAPSAEMRDKFPYVAMMVNRGPSYYLVALAAFMPASLFALGALRPRLRDEDTGLLAGYLTLILVAFTAIGVAGAGYQTRHVLPALPALCLIAGRVIARLPRWSWWVAGSLLLWSAWTLQANLADASFEHSAEVELFLPWAEQGSPIR